MVQKLRIGILTTTEAPPAQLQEAEDRITLGEIGSILRDAGHDVTWLGGISNLAASLDDAWERLDLVLNLDPSLESAVLLEQAGLAATGSPSTVIGLAAHRFSAKHEVERAGVATPTAVVVPGVDDRRLEPLRYPALVKPLIRRRPGAEVSAGSRVEDAEAARHLAQRLVDEGRGPALVETLVRGVEVQVPLLASPGPRALGVLAVAIEGQPLDGDAILSPDVSEYRLVEPPPAVDEKRVRQAAVRAFEALGLRDYGRIDLRIGEDGTPWFLAAHPVPDLGSTGAFGHVGDNAPLADVLLQIVRAAAVRAQRN